MFVNSLKSTTHRLFEIGDQNRDGVLQAPLVLLLSDLCPDSHTPPRRNHGFQPQEMAALLKTSGFHFSAGTINALVLAADVNGGTAILILIKSTHPDFVYHHRTARTGISMQKSNHDTQCDSHKSHAKVNIDISPPAVFQATV